MMIDADRAELINDDGHASAVIRRQNSVQQCRLSGPEETRQNSHRHSLIINFRHEPGMSMKLKGKVAFITGFGSGLGQAIAVMFAREGAAVAGTSPTESKGRQTVALVEKLGGKALYWPGDVSDSKQMKKIIGA